MTEEQTARVGEILGEATRRPREWVNIPGSGCRVRVNPRDDVAVFVFQDKDDIVQFTRDVSHIVKLIKENLS